MKTNAQAILGSSPIGYIRDARPCGSLFEQDSNGMVAGVDTGLFVDHREPLDALRYIQDELNWPLGDLTDGSEFLLLPPPPPGLIAVPDSARERVCKSLSEMAPLSCWVRLAFRNCVYAILKRVLARRYA